MDLCKKFLSFFIFKREFVTVSFHTLLNTDYNGMRRELFNVTVSFHTLLNTDYNGMRRELFNAR